MAPSQIETVVMTARGLQPDTRLHVLDRTIYHVHSTILSLQSNFFHKFFDSAEKLVPDRVVHESGFKYEWVTRVDADGGDWSLESAEDGVIRSYGMDKLTGDLDLEADIFGSFISALYGKPYRLYSLIGLCKFADYYCALPAVSRTISDALYKNWEYPLIRNVLDVISVAVKFRHRQLFTDCVIILAGKQKKLNDRNFDGEMEEDLALLEPEVGNVVRHARAGVNEQIKRVKDAMDEETREDSEFSKLVAETGWVYDSLPKFYRFLHSRFCHGEGLLHHTELGDALVDLMRKNANTLSNLRDQSGEGVFEDYFLSAGVLRDDCPWDQEEEDW